MVSGRRKTKICEALLLLQDAYEYARDAGSEPKDFSLEIEQLRSTGMNNNELRWLVANGYVEHHLETTLPGDQVRTFRPGAPLKFRDSSCFVLTADGNSAALSLCGDVRHHVEARHPSTSRERVTQLADEALEEETTPRWDGERHELWLGKSLVKQFKRPARNQEAILAAFQEEGWPPSVTDPLSPVPEVDPKGRLNDAIKCLNRNQKNPLLRFKGNGTADGVIWEWTTGNGSPRLLHSSADSSD